jgi:hypothetical protein
VVAYRHVTGDERATQIARPAVQALLERHLPPVAAPTRAPKLRATPPDRPAAARRGTQKQRA